MEKYRSSADPSTGIHPFLPPDVPLNLLAKPLILLRLPLLLVCLAVYAPLSFLCGLLPFAALSYWARRLVDMLLLPPMLVCLGVWRVNAVTVERPRTRVDTKDKAKSGGGVPKPRRGDVIVVNHASPLDLLYLQRHYSPVFVVPTYQLPSKYDPTSSTVPVVPLSLSAALRRVSCAPPLFPAEHPAAVTLYDACRRRSAPVVLLAEGCATNGLGVLQFALPFAVLPTPDLAPRIFALGLSYSRSRVETRPLRGALLPSALFFLTLPSANIRGRLAAIAPTDMKHLQRTVASLAGNAPLSIGYEYGMKFAQHWEKTH